MTGRAARPSPSPGLGLRSARVAAVVLAGSGLIVASLSFASVVTGQGPLAAAGLANPGSGRLDGIGITLSAMLFEVTVLLAVAAAGRRAAIDR